MAGEGEEIIWQVHGKKERRMCGAAMIPSLLSLGNRVGRGIFLSFDPKPIEEGEEGKRRERSSCHKEVGEEEKKRLQDEDGDAVERIKGRKVRLKSRIRVKVKVTLRSLALPLTHHTSSTERHPGWRDAATEEMTKTNKKKKNKTHTQSTA